MSDDRKRETIVWLLERYEDALMERTMIPNGRNGHESVLLTSGPWWGSPAFQELERCLDKMRLRAAYDEVSWNAGKDEKRRPYPAGSCSRRAARWHVIAWYVQTERRQKDMWVDVLNHNGQPSGKKVLRKRTDKSGGAIQVVRHPDARQEKAEAGVNWIIGEFKKWTAAGKVTEHWEDRIGDENRRRHEKVAA